MIIPISNTVAFFGNPPITRVTAPNITSTPIGFLPKAKIKTKVRDYNVLRRSYPLDISL